MFILWLQQNFAWQIQYLTVTYETIDKRAYASHARKLLLKTCDSDPYEEDLSCILSSNANWNEAWCALRTFRSRFVCTLDTRDYRALPAFVIQLLDNIPSQNSCCELSSLYHSTSSLIFSKIYSPSRNSTFLNKLHFICRSFVPYHSIICGLKRIPHLSDESFSFLTSLKWSDSNTYTFLMPRWKRGAT